MPVDDEELCKVLHLETFLSLYEETQKCQIMALACQHQDDKIEGLLVNSYDEGKKSM